jgi:hypothetical protein
MIPNAKEQIPNKNKYLWIFSENMGLLKETKKKKIYYKKLESFNV